MGTAAGDTAAADTAVAHKAAAGAAVDIAAASVAGAVPVAAAAAGTADVAAGGTAVAGGRVPAVVRTGEGKAGAEPVDADRGAADTAVRHLELPVGSAELASSKVELVLVPACGQTHPMTPGTLLIPSRRRLEHALYVRP